MCISLPNTERFSKFFLLYAVWKTSNNESLSHDVRINNIASVTLAKT